MKKVIVLAFCMAVSGVGYAHGWGYDEYNNGGWYGGDGYMPYQMPCGGYNGGYGGGYGTYGGYGYNPCMYSPMYRQPPVIIHRRIIIRHYHMVPRMRPYYPY